MVARKKMYGNLYRLDDIFEVIGRLRESWQRGHGIDNIAQMNHEAGLWIHGGYIQKDMPGTGIGELICLVRRTGNVFLLVYMRVRDNYKRKELFPPGA